MSIIFHGYEKNGTSYHCTIAPSVSGAVLLIQAAPRSSPLDMVVGSRASNHGKAIATNLNTTMTRQSHIVTQGTCFQEYVWLVVHMSSKFDHVIIHDPSFTSATLSHC